MRRDFKHLPDASCLLVLLMLFCYSDYCGIITALSNHAGGTSRCLRVPHALASTMFVITIIFYVWSINKIGVLLRICLCLLTLILFCDQQHPVCGNFLVGISPIQYNANIPNTIQRKYTQYNVPVLHRLIGH